MPQHYKVKLTPVNNFFFGREADFENGERRYLTKSKIWPQQSSLLGLLRYCILRDTNNLDSGDGFGIPDPEGAKQLIGLHSFHVNEQPNHYGIIDSLTEVTMAHEDGNTWYPMPFDFKAELVELANAVRNGYGKAQPFYQVNNLNKTPSQYVINQKGERMNLDAVVQFKAQTGIHRALNQERENAGLYFQHFASFRQRGWHFQFGFTLKEEASWIPTSTTIVPFGGEQSRFVMEITKVELPLPIEIRNPASEVGLHGLALLTPAYCPEVIKYIATLNSSKVKFRYLYTHVNQTKQRYNWTELNEDNLHKTTQRMRSKLFHLLDRGTCIYYKPENETAVLEALTTQCIPKNFYQIGYNRFIQFTNQ